MLVFVEECGIVPPGCQSLTLFPCTRSSDISTMGHRSYVRTKYSIPESRHWPVAGSEDVCCSLVCPCFTAAQLLRHTTDYEEYEAARCCSDTGLPFHVPAIIV